MATLLDGGTVAAELRDDRRDTIEGVADAGVRPGLATVHIGEDLAAESDINMKQRDCEELGSNVPSVDADPDAPAEVFYEVLSDPNENGAVHGILVRGDVPEHVDQLEAVGRIGPMNDVRSASGERRSTRCRESPVRALHPARRPDGSRGGNRNRERRRSKPRIPLDDFLDWADGVLITLVPGSEFPESHQPSTGD